MRTELLLFVAILTWCSIGRSTAQVAQVPEPLIDLNAEGLAAGPVDFWPSDGSLGGTFDAIVSPQDLYSWNDAPPISETVAGRTAVTFDNNGMEATVSPPESIAGANPVCTVVFQVFNPDYIAGAGGVEIAMEWGTRAGAQWAGFGIGDNNWGAASFFGGGRDFSYGGSPPATGEWQVVFMTVDGSLTPPEIKVYVENTLVNEATNNANPPFDIVGTPFVMGGTRDAGTNRNTTASYARVQVYDSVLSDAQRDELYGQLVRRGGPAELPPPLAQYSFDDGTASDSSSNGLDGTLQGGAEVVEDDERGQVLALNLDDADDDYVTIDDPGGRLDFSAGGPNEGSATTMAWVKSGLEGDWTVHTTIFSQGEWDDGVSLSLKGDVDPDGQVWVAGDGTHSVVHRSDIAPPAEGWHHVAVTFGFDGLETLISVYVDGEKTGFSEGDGITPGQVSAPVNGMSRIGLEDRSGDGSLSRWGFNGYIDDLRIYDVALTQAEIQAAAEGGTVPSERPCPIAPRGEPVGANIELSWRNGDVAPNSVDIRRNDELIADDAAATPPEYVDQNVEPGVHAYELTFDVPGANCDPLMREVDTCIRGFAGSFLGGETALSWTNARPYDGVRVNRDGQEIAVLAGDAEEYVDTDAPAGDRTYDVEPTTGSCDPATVVVNVREAPDEPELLLYYDFNDDSEPELVLDRTENENDAEVFGFAAYAEDGSGLSGEAGDLALDFGDFEDGSYLNVVTASDDAFEAINERDQATITMWCFGDDQLPANTIGFRFFNDRDLIAERILACHIPWGNGNFYLDVADVACCNNRIQANAPPEDYKGRWNHYAFVKDGPVSAIYINGEVLVDSGDSNHDSMEPYPITGVVFGGGQGGTNSYGGLWDELTVWAGALTLTRIREVMENGPLPPEPMTPRFVRGDANADGSFNISDGTFLLNSLFAGGPDPTCGDAADANADGGINIADGVYVLNALFGGGDQPGSPFPDCDVGEIRVGCDSFAPCP